jgi:hypothetical protein
VVGQHQQPAAGTQQVDGVLEGGGQHLELGVDGDPQGLEDPAGGVPATAAGRSRDGVAHDLGESARRGDGPGGHDRPGDARGEALLAVGGEQAAQGLLVRPVDQSGGVPWAVRVHPHVEGGVGPVAEAPLRTVELVGADPEVEQGAGQSRDPLTGRHLP